jgi:hypothetical protein
MKQSCTKLRVTLWWTAGDLLRMFDDSETPKLCHLHLSQQHHMMESVLNSKGPPSQSRSKLSKWHSRALHDSACTAASGGGSILLLLRNAVL